MKYAHLLTAFFCEPWNLRPDYHANFSRILQRHLAGESAPAAVFNAQREPLAALSRDQRIIGPTCDGQPVVPQMAVFGGVAIVPVYGVLGRRLSMLDLACGGVDYEHLSAFFEMAESDPAVSLVVLDFDSPGGRVSGLPECAAALASLAAAKPVFAYTSGLCCSAAYYLACYARQVFASPSAQVGNIGTRLACVDDSEAWKMEGLSLELFASGPIKAAGTPGKQWTEEDRAYFRGIMERARDDFFSVVRTNRPQVAEECFDGRWTNTGAEALAAGLADGAYFAEDDPLRGPWTPASREPWRTLRPRARKVHASLQHIACHFDPGR
jgi:ClpP class serine protease